MIHGLPDPPRSRTPGQWAWALFRVGFAGAVCALIVVPSAFLILPVPTGADGVTLCLPGIGPLQQFAEDLEGEQEEVVRIHEDVHAAQCRKLGAATYAATYREAAGRLTLEAEAFCAEIEVLGLRGADTDRLVDRTVETLFMGYRNENRVGRTEVENIVSSACPSPESLRFRRATDEGRGHEDALPVGTQVERFPHLDDTERS